MRTGQAETRLAPITLYGLPPPLRLPQAVLYLSWGDLPNTHPSRHALLATLQAAFLSLGTTDIRARSPCCGAVLCPGGPGLYPPCVTAPHPT